jgi:hypothetical protein
MGNALGKTVVPGPENLLGTKAMLWAVAHKHARSMSDCWDGRFKEKEQEFPDRQPEEEE